MPLHLDRPNFPLNHPVAVENRRIQEEQKWEAIRQQLQPTEMATIANGLRVAAKRFDEDAVTARAAGHPRMAAQFERQAAESLEIAARLE